MQSLTSTDRSELAIDDVAIDWLRTHGWTIGCTGCGDEWLITGYKVGGRIKGAGNTLMEALLAAWEQAQEYEDLPVDSD